MSNEVQFILFRMDAQTSRWAGRGHKRAFIYAERWHVETDEGVDEDGNSRDGQFIGTFRHKDHAVKFIELVLGGTVLQLGDDA